MANGGIEFFVLARIARVLSDGVAVKNGGVCSNIIFCDRMAVLLWPCELDYKE